MFEIILTACIGLGGPCAERLIPAQFDDLEACTTQREARVEAWAAEHDDLRIVDFDCIGHDRLAARIDALPVREIADGVFVHQARHDVPTEANAGDLANLGFAIGTTSVAVIDAGGSRQVAERLYAAIRAQTPLPIESLIITHMHPDHSLGAAFFREAGAQIIGHPNLELALANRSESYLRAMERLMGATAFLGTRMVGPNETAMTRIDLGGRALAITYVDETAHTETDVVVLDEVTGTLFTGDLVFVGHTPALDGSILGWQEVLERLAKQEFARIVPGHGPAALDWPVGADAVRAYLRAITLETRAAIAAGEPMSRAVRHIGESQRSNWVLFDEFNQRNATASYKELEWE